MPRSCCACSTASHNLRSATTLCSGLKISAIAVEAYRAARTFGMAGLDVTATLFRTPEPRLDTGG